MRVGVRNKFLDAAIAAEKRRRRVTGCAMAVMTLAVLAVIVLGAKAVV